MARQCEPAVIVWVDDNTHQFSYLIHALEAEGWSVEVAANATQGRELVDLHRRTVRLVITDVHMPRGQGFTMLETDDDRRSGVALAEWVCRSCPGTRVLGHSYAVSTKRLFEALGHTYLRKDPDRDPEAFCALVRQIVKG